MELPKVYEYYEVGEYDSAQQYFDEELAEDGTTWCKAFDTVVMYQLAKERIQELQDRVNEYDTAVLNVLKHGFPPLTVMRDEEHDAFQELKRVFETGGL